MKSALLGIVSLFVVVITIAASCSVDHRSGTFACTTQSQCNDGRTCMDGFCVVTGDHLDAPLNGDAPRSDANNCPSPCTSCNLTTHTCTIDCAMASGACSSHVTCPANFACNLQCDTDNACRNGVTCTNTTSCTIACSGKQACDAIECGTSKCNVSCTGQSSCKDVSCNNSCACDVTCSGPSSCAGNVTCTAPACDIGLGCSSFAPTCHSC